MLQKIEQVHNCMQTRYPGGGKAGERRKKGEEKEKEKEAEKQQKEPGPEECLVILEAASSISTAVITGSV